jgi:putative ABC transport system permease protein
LLAYVEFEYLRDRNEVFSGMFTADSYLQQAEVILGDSSTDGHKQQARIKLVSGGYFTTLGIRPAAGRIFSTEVDRAVGASPVVDVSYTFWGRRFGLSPSILGKVL